ncbi:MAG: helix-turn-helix transcriptional regulator [Clostridia bacterium]|nr:helix-turn-helix transcriptional regulator [Clostridia bacterium]
MIINNRLKDLRSEKGLTQKEVAEQLKVSTTCYSGYEQGYREPDLKTLIKICKFFEVSSDYLLGLKDE